LKPRTRTTWIVSLCAATILLVIGAALTVVHLPAFLVWRQVNRWMDDETKGPLLLAEPVRWEPINASGPRVSVGFGSFSLASARDCTAVVRHTGLHLKQGTTSFVFLGAFRTGGETGATSPDTLLEFDAASTKVASRAELRRMSHAERQQYLAKMTLKMLNAHAENGVVLLDTAATRSLIRLGTRDEPERVHIVLSSKTMPIAVGVYVIAESAQDARALAHELASSWDFNDTGRTTATELERAIVEGLRGWLPAESVTVQTPGAPSRK
jgi:hypothetical protein